MKAKDGILSVLFAVMTLAYFEFEPRFLVTQPLTYLLAAWFGAYGIWWLAGSPKQAWLMKLRWLATGLLSLAMVLSIYWPNITAKWGVIDDHEIMNNLGSDGKMSLQDIPERWVQSEAALPGKVPRYRPVYQTLRLFETAAWDNNPTGWYVTRLLFMTSFLAVIWWLSTPLLGWVGGGVVTLYIFSYDFWKDVLARLGPSEAYLVFGLALGLWCFAIIWRALPKRPVKWTWWLGLAVGAVITVGSKENMVLMVVPLAVLFVRTMFYRRLTLPAITSFVAQVAMVALVTWAVMVATLTTGQDVYAQSTSAQSRTQILILSFKTHQSKQLMVTIGLLVGLTSLTWLTRNPDTQKLLPTQLRAGIYLMGLWALFITQFVFYNGHWPDHNRYDFPGLLYEPMYYLVLLWLVVSLLRQLKLPTAVTGGIKWGFLLGLGCLVIMRGFVSTKVAVAENATRTRAFTAYIEKIAAELRSHPQVPVVVESASVWDYEPIYSYRVFLTAQEISNPFYLRLHGYDETTVSPGLEAGLARQLEQISVEGNNAYRPLPELPQSEAGCYSLVLSGIVETECRVLQ